MQLYQEPRQGHLSPTSFDTILCKIIHEHVVLCYIILYTVTYDLHKAIFSKAHKPVTYFNPRLHWRVNLLCITSR